MATFTAPDRSWDIGVPKKETHDFGVTAHGLIIGETPPQFTVDMVTAYSQTLAAYTIVGQNAAGEIIPAVWNADPEVAVQAIGILLYPVTTGASGTKPVARVLRSGAINPLYAGLVWPASYNTEAKKMNAFEGAPSPTQFITRPLSHGTPVTP